MADYGNYIVIFSLAIISFVVGVNRTIHLIQLSCLISQMAYIANIDIALYYSVQCVVSIATAYYAHTTKTIQGKFLSVLMSFQFLLCFSLVSDWGYSLNSVLQFKLDDFNDMMIIILIVIGVMSSGKLNNRSDNNS